MQSVTGGPAHSGPLGARPVVTFIKKLGKRQKHHLFTGQKYKRRAKNGMIIENQLSFDQEERSRSLHNWRNLVKLHDRSEPAFSPYNMGRVLHLQLRISVKNTSLDKRMRPAQRLECNGHSLC